MIYKLFDSGYQKFIINLETNGYIPFDPANTDYQSYLKWVDEGGITEPADE